MKQTPLEAQLEQEIYVDRLLVFLEDKDGFRQVILTPEQFKKVSDACILDATPPDERGFQSAEINLGDKVLDKRPFENMNDISYGEATS